MFRALLAGVTSALVLVGACGDSDPLVGIPSADAPDTGLTAKDGSSAPDSTFNDGSVPSDAAVADATIVDGATDATITDSAATDGATTDGASSNDGATNDASADAASDAAGPDAQTDAATSDAQADATADSGIPTSTLALDESLGANTYGGGLSAGGNWVSVHAVSPNAGTHWFGSGNGSNNTFVDLYFKKQLGGVVENRTYA